MSSNTHNKNSPPQADKVANEPKSSVPAKGGVNIGRRLLTAAILLPVVMMCFRYF